MMADVEDVRVVLANNDRVTLRVGDVFLKIDADQARTDVEVEAMALAPVPTPKVLWRRPPVLALRPWTPAFIHSDLHRAHVLIDGVAVAGIIDWSAASQGDPLYDLATLTLAHQDHYDSVGVWDGWLKGVGSDAPFEEAVDALDAFVMAHWTQHLPSP